MPRRKNPDKMVSIAIPEKIHLILTKSKLANEPLYRVLERMMAKYYESGDATKDETIQKQSKVIQIYFERIQKLEAEKMQVKLI